MHTHNWYLRARAATISCVLLLAATTVSFGQATFGEPGQTRPDTVTAEPVSPGAATLGAGEIPVMVKFRGDSAALTFHRSLRGEGRGAALAKARTQVQKLDRDQRDQVAKILRAHRKSRVLYRLQKTLNGVAMVVDAADVPAIAALPEVESVVPITLLEPHAASSNPMMRVESFWDALPSGLDLKGEGIKVGIIDSGIDYVHTNFGGSGSAADYAAVTDTNPAGLFPNAKVVGGWDFVGDAYTGANAAVPDANPFARINGHGTSVASLVAGFGVTATGATYAGPYDSTTDYGALRISPGVAPKALIYALRVFGNSGSTAFAAQAIEWAMDPNGDDDLSDRLDVINLSLGSANGHFDDLSSQIADAATKAGIVVVISAGNSYNIYYNTGSPSVGDGAISVAASLNDLYYHTLQINSPADIAQSHPMVPAAFGPAYSTAGLTSDLVLGDPLVGVNDNFAALTNAAAVAGKIVVMERGAGIGFTTKVRNAQNSGAIGVIMLNNLAGAPITMGGADPLVTIPSTMVTMDVGTILKTKLLSSTVNVTASSSGGAGADTMATYSSRGPRRGDSMLKPDITAPAELVSSALVGSGNANTPFNGTSSSAPHVTGSMVLMRQANPLWTPDELKALAMNTAKYDPYEAFSGLPGVPKWYATRVGAGVVDLEGASYSEVIAFNKDAPDLVSVSYGQVEASTPLDVTRQISLRNKSGSPVTYNISWQALAPLPGVTVDFDAQVSVSAAAGATADFPVVLRVDPALMKNVRDPLVPPTERISTSTVTPNYPRHFLNEISGHVVLTPASGTAPVIRVPVWAAVRPAGAMSTGGAFISLTTPTGAINVPVSGVQLNTGSSYPNDITGLVKGFELHHEAAANALITGDRKGAELQYAGVTSDYRISGNNVAATWLTFGVSTHGQWDTPALHGVQMQVQITNDLVSPTPAPRFTVFTNAPTDLDTGTAASTSNVYTTYFTNHTAGTTSFFPSIAVNGLSPQTINTYAMNNSAIAITIPASTVGITAAAPVFRYKVRGVWRGVLVSESAWVRYDVTKPGLDMSGASNAEPFWYLALNSNTVPVLWNAANLKANSGKGLLLLFPQNVHGMRAEKVGAADITLPVISSLKATPAVLGMGASVLVPVTLTVVASDNVDPTPVSTISSVTSTVPLVAGVDYEITGPLTLKLKRKVAGPRNYIITVKCTDSWGNSAYKSVKVSSGPVPIL